MNVDYLTLACLRDHLDSLLGARVQRVVLPDERSIGLELYAGRRAQLLISADPQHPRMLLAPQKLRRGAKTETPLLLLLRKWVRDSRLVDVTQPPWERILELHFGGRSGPCRLIAELIGRTSNVILVGPNGDVLDAVKRIGPDLNRYRVILPGHPYRPPPRPAGRRPPTDLTPNEWVAMLAAADAGAPLHRLLTSHLLGVSPMVAREVAVRATGHATSSSRGDPEAPARAATAQALSEATAALFAPIDDGSWAPHVALDKDDCVIAFAPYELRQFERTQPVRRISDAMCQFFQQQLSADGYAAARWRVREQIDRARARVERALDQLRENVADEDQIEALREAGQLLLTYQGQVKRDAPEVTVPDYGGDPRTIELDPALTPVENAQAYFRRYRKAVRGAGEIPARVEALEADRAYLDQLAADLVVAESRPEIDAVVDALAEAGWAPRESRGSSGQVGGPRRFEVGGFSIYVGRNARQNDVVTFRRAGPDDLWLHVRGLPGAHVVVKRGKRAVPEDVIQHAARLAARHSPARDSDRVAVDVTERRFVRRVRGGHPGLVTYRNERTVWVEPEG